jgi:hypothetical protein
MTPSEATTVQKAVSGLWPQLASGKGQWSPDEWHLFAEKIRTINTEGEQAISAIREAKARSAKTPRVAELLRVIKQTVVGAVATAGPKVIRDPKRWRLAEMRRVLNIDGTDSQVVEDWILDSAERSVRLRGFVTEEFWARAHADLIELAGWGSKEADEWLLDQSTAFLDKPPKELTEMQRWHKKLKGTQSVSVSHIHDLAQQRIARNAGEKE